MNSSPALHLPRPRLAGPVLAFSAFAFATPFCLADALTPAWAIVPSGTILDDGEDPPEQDAVTLPAGLNFGNTYNNYPWFLNNATGTNRDMDVNPVTGNVIVGNSSTGTSEMHVIDSDGVELRSLDMSVVSGGYHALNTVSVADDGVVYGTNMVLNATSNFLKIYRWESDAEGVVPIEAFVGDPGNGSNTRWGDSFDVTGSGLDTLLMVSPRLSVAGTAPVCIFTTTDTDLSDGMTWEPHLVADVGFGGGNIVFSAFGKPVPGYDDPATPGTVENLTLVTVFTKASEQFMRRTLIRPDTWTVVSTNIYNGSGGNPPAIATGVLPIGSLPSKNWLGGIEMVAGSDRAQFYDVSASNGATVSIPTTAPTLAINNSNLNGTGGVAFFVAGVGQTPGAGGIPLRSRMYAMSSNNSLVAYDIIPPAVTPPPTVTAQPANTTVIAGWNAVFAVTAAGTPPISYQWLVDHGAGAGFEVIAGATSSTLLLNSVQVTPAPLPQYRVDITDAGGTTSSTPATLTVQARVDTAVMTTAYKIPVDTPGRPYLTSSGTQRGLAYNPAGDHLLIVNRAPITGLPNPSVMVLDAATGAEILEGDMPRTLLLNDPDNQGNDVATGTFVLSAIDCDDTGVVYASNLAAADTPGLYKIYRWADDGAATPPKVAFGPGDVFNNDGLGGDRAGEHLKVRGSGLNTQILVGARNLEKFAIFTTTDGETFTPTVFSVPEARPAGTTTPSGAFFMCDFGAGNTIWAKTDLGKLIRVAFDLTAVTATIQQTITTAAIPSGIAPIAVDPVRQLLAGVHTAENPNNLRLYNYNLIGQPGGLLDLEFFPTDNPNGNRVGAVDLGNNRVYALDTNNGLVVMNINYTLPAPPVLTNLSRTGNDFSFTLTGVANATYLIQRSADMTVWTDDGTVTLDGGGSATVTRTTPEGRYFFRAKQQ